MKRYVDALERALLSCNHLLGLQIGIPGLSLDLRSQLSRGHREEFRRGNSQ